MADLDWAKVQERLVEFVPEPNTKYTPDNTPHPEVPMKNKDGETAMIDKEIAPLILTMWNAGIPTRFCCQGHEVPPGQDPNAWAWDFFKGYIAMPRTDKSLSFVQAIVSNFLTKVDRGYSWDIEFSENTYHGPMLTIRFPKEDIEELRKFTQFVAGIGVL